MTTFRIYCPCGTGRRSPQGASQASGPLHLQAARLRGPPLPRGADEQVLRVREVLAGGSPHDEPKSKGPSMKRPIIFSCESVRAILDGRKTQTRRLVKPQAETYTDDVLGQPWMYPVNNCYADPSVRIRSPHGKPGDRLWVREPITWREGFGRAYFDADEKITQVDNWGWKRFNLPAIFMPYGAHRIDLEITDVRVQRLQDITEEDAKAEGMLFHDGGGVGHSGWRHDVNYGFVQPSARTAFAVAWDRINGKRATWESDPWVWAIAFNRIKP